MATFDGSSSLDKACDEFRGPECGPCSRRKRTRIADYFCQDCPEYLCNDCKDYHGDLAVTRNHTIVSGNSIPSSVSIALGSGSGAAHSLGISCDCNKGQAVEFYCNSHQDAICKACKTFHHQKCKTSSIQEKCSGYKAAMLKSVLAEIKSIAVKFDRLKQESSGNKKEIDKITEDCENDIQVFRKEVKTIFDNLESNLLSDVNKWKQGENRRVDQDMSTIDTTENVLKVDRKRVEDAIRVGKKEVMFVADIQVSKSLNTYKRKLEDLENDIEKPSLAFERNEILFDLVAGIDKLGSLVTKHKDSRQVLKQPAKSYSTDSATILKDRNIKSRREVNVRTGDDQEESWISGCTVIPKGHVVVCDQRNKQIKLLDDSWTITGQLQLPDPWDVSVLDSSHVIVSSPENKQLQKVHVFSKMKVVSTIQLDRVCWGVAVSGEEIYTTCHDDPGKGEVVVLDLQGNIKRRLGTNPDGSYLFTGPSYITVSASGEKIFVSDYNTDSITCLTPSGTVIYTYIDGDMRDPRGLICDSGDNVLVCGRLSHNVHIISPDGKKYRTLLTSKDGLSFPWSIAYKESEDTLIVICLRSDKLLLFKLE